MSCSNLFSDPCLDAALEANDNFKEQLKEGTDQFDAHMKSHTSDPGAMGVMPECFPSEFVGHLFDEKLDASAGAEMWFSTHRVNYLRMGVSHLPLVGLACILKTFDDIAVQLIPMELLLSKYGMPLNGLSAFLETHTGADFSDSDHCVFFRMPPGLLLHCSLLSQLTFAERCKLGLSRSVRFHKTS